MALNRKQLYRFLAESIGEKIADTAEDSTLISKIDRDIKPYVDLGLPSGTLWAKCNLGAENEWDYGDYFGWGMDRPYEQDETTDVYFSSFAKRIKQDLADETDAATVLLGKNWAMPTKEQAEELQNFTYSCYGVLKNIKGRFCFKPKDVSHRGQKNKSSITSLYSAERDEYIFLPFSGVKDDFRFYDIGDYGTYRCSTIGESRDNSLAYCIDIDDYFFAVQQCARAKGYSIRAVIK